MADTAAEVSAMAGGKKSSKWMTHLKKTMRAHPGKSLGAVMKMAAKTYKKGGAEEPMMGGAAPLTPLPLSGGRRKTRKGGRKSRKGGRKY